MYLDQLDPADIRFTQDSIGLYFQRPYSYFSIRDAVRKISRNEMRPEDFPQIQVIFYDGQYWSIDNRRLWVFRFARCSSVTVLVDTMIHERLQAVISSRMLGEMKGPDFFPRVCDKGLKDWDFVIQFPTPLSSERLKNQGSKTLLSFQPSRNGGCTEPAFHWPGTDDSPELASFQSSGSGSSMEPTFRMPETDDSPEVPSSQASGISRSTDCENRPSAPQPEIDPFATSPDVEGQCDSPTVHNHESGRRTWIFLISEFIQVRIDYLKERASQTIKAASLNLMKAAWTTVKAASQTTKAAFLNLIKAMKHASRTIKAAFP